MVRIEPWAWGEVQECQKVINGKSWGCFWEFGAGGSESFQIHHGTIPGIEGRNSHLSPKCSREWIPHSPFPLHGKTRFNPPHSPKKFPILELEIPSRRGRSPEQRLGNGKGNFWARLQARIQREKFLQSRGIFPIAWKNEEFHPDGSVPATLTLNQVKDF